MTKSITYKKLIKLLHLLHFKDSSQLGSHLKLVNTEYGSMIILPIGSINSHIPVYIYKMTRKNVVEKGIVTAAQFDKMIEEI